MDLTTYGFAIIIVISIVLIALFFARPSLFAVRGGKILAFFAFLSCRLPRRFSEHRCRWNIPSRPGSVFHVMSWSRTAKVSSETIPPIFPRAIFKTTEFRQSRPVLRVTPLTRCLGTSRPSSAACDTSIFTISDRSPQKFHSALLFRTVSVCTATPERGRSRSSQCTRRSETNSPPTALLV